jgi:CheY-like chemotaxis protein
MLSTSRLKLLVVEDHAFIRIPMCQLLAAAGHEVLAAGSADEALGLLVSLPTPVDLVFTDIEMPGSMNGLELSIIIKKRWPQVAVIVTSGNVRPPEHLLPPGAAFIAKPTTAQIVLQTIASASLAR